MQKLLGNFLQGMKVFRFEECNFRKCIVKYIYQHIIFHNNDNNNNNNNNNINNNNYYYI